ncbi:uncharacterized protein PHALS_02066 [Plasmopara halstedii]|uniref:RxLR-like protein n=1 Tax=Plasmopara halstedii TaxID=4781 RepID=A0A0P1ATU3_PLAHL|nr:uncharacterized protein PHALS_02066 [Plasmopara halstedii]CEG45794.1 hypothetical protein PHALS_02066 [Plasmopara halstedii]|eukprot:XP_024582163.1 hypothetical protein PHALS_02066 [Plasmopara halstedii]
MHKISFALYLFIAVGAKLTSTASVVSTVTNSATITSTVVYPSLIQCVCNTTLVSAGVIKSSTPSTQAQNYDLSDCSEDVFAETGIRWYLNGPLVPGINYWRQAPQIYATGRAALRYMRLGYRCTRIQLYVSTDS